MSKKEIIEGNKLIAEFMGWTCSTRISYNDNRKVLYKPNGTIFKYGKLTYLHNKNPWDAPLKFHSSWDWLMPVVEKITTKDNYSVNIHYGTGATDSFAWCTFYNNGEQITSDDINTDEQNLITAIWKSVIDFIKWYNKRIKK